MNNIHQECFINISRDELQTAYLDGLPLAKQERVFDPAITKILFGFGDLDIDEVIQSFLYQREKIKFHDHDQTSCIIATSTANAPSVIPEQKIKTGYKGGLIDLGKTALLKTKQGWISPENRIVVDRNASYETILAHIQKKHTVTPSFTHKELEQIEKEGLLTIKGKLIAEKNNDGHWEVVKTGEVIRHGGVNRVLHHQDQPVVTYPKILQPRFYHGSISTSKAPNKDLSIRKGSSAQGDAIYGTASLKEAVKIYGNPLSFENKGKMIDEPDKALFEFGHLYEITTDEPVFLADHNENTQYIGSIPSLPSLLLLGQAAKIPVARITSVWRGMAHASNRASVYAAINELNEEANRNGFHNFLPRVIQSLGFSGIQINIPDINRCKERATEFLSSELLEDERSIRNDVVSKNITNYIARLEDSTPAKGEVAHLVSFDLSSVTVHHIGLLPKNLEMITDKPDPFYDLTEKLEKESLEQYFDTPKVVGTPTTCGYGN